MGTHAATTVRLRSSDHRAFGRLSGDTNPIHTAGRWARRSFAGEPVVHGVHLLLRALDVHFKGTRGAAGPVTITARFLKPGFPGESIDVASARDGASGATTLTVFAAGARLAEVVITPRPPGDTPTPPDGISIASIQPSNPRREAAVLTVEEADGASGAITPADPNGARRAFPRAARALGHQAVAAIARTSAIAGMECPGRDSMLSQITLDVTPGARTTALYWRVVRADRTLRLVRLSVRGDGFAGTVQAFVRRPPPPAPDVAAIAARVTPGEFAGQKALIVGGSRGLGAATAALVAVGGGLAVLTYHSSGDDAAALRRAIGGAGFRAETLRLDVVEHSDDLAKVAAKFGITHLYYFATPSIFVRRREPFDVALFHRFCEVYVDGFARACAAVASARPSVAVFYPSSTTIGEFVSDVTEYSAAKAAGETLCDVLPRTLSGMTIMRMRLPRMTTDQTASLTAAPAADPVDVMLPIVRELHRSGAPTVDAERV